jgi:beta-glucosidase
VALIPRHFADLGPGAAACLDIARIASFSVFPRWNDQRGVQMTVRNVAFRP